jgi:hypothetical protein
MIADLRANWPEEAAREQPDSWLGRSARTRPRRVGIGALPMRAPADRRSGESPHTTRQLTLDTATSSGSSLAAGQNHVATACHRAPRLPRLGVALAAAVTASLRPRSPPARRSAARRTGVGRGRSEVSVRALNICQRGALAPGLEHLQATDGSLRRKVEPDDEARLSAHPERREPARLRGGSARERVPFQTRRRVALRPWPTMPGSSPGSPSAAPPQQMKTSADREAVAAEATHRCQTRGHDRRGTSPPRPPFVGNAGRLGVLVPRRNLGSTNR